MASPFKEVNVIIKPDNSRLVYWNFTPKVEIPSSAKLSVQYARSLSSWQTLVKDLPISYCYTDSRVTNRNKYNNDFYRIALYTSDSQSYISQPQQAGINLSYPYSSEANNLNRLTSLQLKKTGRQGFLMKKIMYGQKCPVCKQFDDDAPVNQHCPQCLGTGIKGGYYIAMPMNILQQGQTNNTNIAQTGVNVSITMSAKSIAWPLIEYGDIWSDKYTNQRYYIDSVSVLSKYKHVPLVYSLRMHLIELSDVVHTKKANDALQQAFVEVKSDWEKQFE